MKKITKNILIISSCCIVGGAILAGIGFVLGGSPGMVYANGKITSPSQKAKPYTLAKTKLDSFENAEFNIRDCSDIQIEPSNDDNFYLEYQVDGHYSKPDYRVSGKTFTCTQGASNHRSFNVMMIGGFSDEIDSYMILYVPEKATLKSLKLYSDTGDVSIDKLHAGETSFEGDCSDLSLSDSTFQTLSLTSDTGDLSVKNVTASALSLNVDYGDIDIKNLSCDTAAATLDTCDLTLDATKLTDFQCKNSYGDIELRLPGDPSSYSYDIAVDYGEISLPNVPMTGTFQSDDDDDSNAFKSTGTGKGTIKIYNDSGDISVS